MRKSENHILLAKIGAPHGVCGQVRVKSFTERPLAFGDFGPLFSKDGRTFSLLKARSAKNALVAATFLEIQNRNEAESVRGLELFTRRECLPEILDDDEFYVNDLLGMEVVNEANDVIGRIRAIPDFGAGALLEISSKPGNGDSGANAWYLAFTKANVPDIDFDNRRVTIIRPCEISERDDENY